MQVPKKYQSYEIMHDNAFIINTDSISLKLVFMSDDVFRIRTNFCDNWDEVSYILIQTAWEDHCDKYLGKERTRIKALLPKFEETNDDLIFHTKTLRLVLKKEEFAFEVYDKNDNLLHADIPNRAFVQDHLGRIYHYSSYRNEKDLFYGFGEHNGTLEKSHQHLRLSPKDAIGHDPNTGGPMYKHIPFYIKHNTTTGQAVGMYYHNTYNCAFDTGAELSGYWPRYSYYTADGGEIDWFFINGPSMAEIVQRYTDLTGKTTLPPKYALGYLGSTMYYVELPKDCDKEIIGFIDKNIKESIPVDGFQLSSGYTVGKDGKRYFFTWNNTRFQDPQKFFDEMMKRGVMCSPNIKPGILLTHPFYHTWSEVKGFILDSEKKYPYIDMWWGGLGSFVDFTSPKGREVWKKHMIDSLLKYGVTSIWNDNCEYEINDHLAYCSLEGKGGSAGELKNIQALLMNRVSHEALAEYCPNERPFVVCRSGSAGIQRYASTWAGDNPTYWDTLQNNIATVLNMGLSGVAHNGCDVGGFQGPHPEEELLLRWVQTGIFFPRFSIHSCNNDNTVTEPWMYKRSAPFIRNAINFRYSLLPHFYSLMKKASELGTPIMRPLCYEFPNDSKSTKERYQFMLGSSLLVAPIVEKGIKEKSVYLPEGCCWYDYYTREQYKGGQIITIPVEMGTIPVFIRENAFVARNSEVFSIRHDKETYWDILVSASQNSTHTLYEDDGVTNNYQNGEYLKTHVDVIAEFTSNTNGLEGTNKMADSISTSADKVTLKVRYEGTFNSSIKNIFLDVINPKKGPYKVFLDGQELPQYLDEDTWNTCDKGWRYHADLKSARIKYPKPFNNYDILISFEPFDLIGMAITEEQNQ